MMRWRRGRAAHQVSTCQNECHTRASTDSPPPSISSHCRRRRVAKGGAAAPDCGTERGGGDICVCLPSFLPLPLPLIKVHFGYPRCGNEMPCIFLLPLILPDFWASDVHFFFFHSLSRIGLYVKGIRVLPDFSVTFFVQSSEFQERDRAGIGAERALQGRGVARETSSYPTHLSWLESFPRLLLLLLLAVVVVFVATVIFVLRSYPPTFF
jgi:hypothetical protein